LTLATDVEGIFRLSGSAKRIKDLQTVFNSPDRYGKGLDWTGYTVHDAANILRRYLNQLPEPIVPLSFYERFRTPLRPYLARSVEGEASFDLTMDKQSGVVLAYQKLITELPPLNRQLLLYILDLLAVFSSKSDLNRMTAANLAAIFQPGILSHPQHDMAPTEYRLSQDVLIFLIENQDHFLFGMGGTGIDEQTKHDIESGVPSVKSPNPNIGRSASNASAGADSLRKYGVRRNVSVGSRGSRERSSPGVSSPGTPTGQSQLSSGPATTGVARSNTLPSKRSPAIASGRFQRMHDSTPTGSPVVPETPAESAEEAVPTPNTVVEPRTPLAEAQKSEQATAVAPVSIPSNATAIHTVQRDRKISDIFARSPLFGPIDPQGKKLQKRRNIVGSANNSANGSQVSLQGEDQAGFQTPLMTPDLNSAQRGDPMRGSPAFVNTAATPINEHPALSPTSAERPNHGPRLYPNKSPAGSLHSRSSVTDQSDFDTLDKHGDLNAAGSTPITAEKERKRHRWRFSSSAKKTDDFPLAPPPRIGENTGARGSNSSISSAPGKAPRKSFTGDSQATTVASSHEGSSTLGHSNMQAHSSHEHSDALKDATNNGEERKGGLFGKWKAKRSEKKEKEAEKERAKSPPRPVEEPGKSRSSLTAFAHDHFGNNPRGRGSFDRLRGGSTAGEGVAPPSLEKEKEAPGGLETVKERPGTEGKEKESLSGMTPTANQNAVSPTAGAADSTLTPLNTSIAPNGDEPTTSAPIADGTEKKEQAATITS
jgi:GTPase-activating protein SAC7